jgi:hypothetical protein
MPSRSWSWGAVTLVACLLISVVVPCAVHAGPNESEMCRAFLDHVLHRAQKDPVLSIVVKTAPPHARTAFEQAVLDQCWNDMSVQTFERAMKAPGIEAFEVAEMWSSIDELDPLPGGRTAAKANLDAIRTAENAYHAEWDVFTACPAVPAEIPGTEAVPFEGAGLRCFRSLGWWPDTDVKCRYSVEVTRGAGEAQGFVGRAECDLDGDGKPMVLTCTEVHKVGLDTDPWVY